MKGWLLLACTMCFAAEETSMIDGTKLGVLVMLGILLAVLFGVWCLAQYGRDAGAGMLAAAIASFAVSLGLVVYDSWFLRKTRTL